MCTAYVSIRIPWHRHEACNECWPISGHTHNANYQTLDGLKHKWFSKYSFKQNPCLNNLSYDKALRLSILGLGLNLLRSEPLSTLSILVLATEMESFEPVMCVSMLLILSKVWADWRVTWALGILAAPLLPLVSPHHWWSNAVSMSHVYAHLQQNPC